MQRIVIVLAIVAVLCPLTPAKSGKDEYAIAQVMNAATEAFARNDATALESIFADDYIFVNPGGAILTRAQRLADLQSGNTKYDSFTLDQMSIRLFGATAVVTGRTVVKGQNRGQDISAQYRVTFVLVKKHGRWQMVAQHSTRIAS